MNVMAFYIINYLRKSGVIIVKIIYKGIKLIGSKNFVLFTKYAIDKIESAGEGFIDFVRDNIYAIKEGKKSGMHVDSEKPVFEVGKRTYSSPTCWYASCIVHDSYHNYLYKEQENYFGEEAEIKCLNKQLKFLSAINEPKNVEYLKKLIDSKTDYWSDYSKRNW